VTVQNFLAHYWAQRPLHLVRGRADFYHSLTSLQEIEQYFSLDEVFERHSLSTPREGYGLPDPPPRSLAELHDRLLHGYALRIRRMECFIQPSAPVLALLRDMELVLQHPKESLSCYVSPSSAQGLGAHHDETEIFTLQISGSKIWRIYHRADAIHAATYAVEDLGEPSFEVTLKPGDLLYMPSRWVHHVTSDVASFSLTIVFNAVTWKTLIDVLLEKLANSPAFLASMPPGVCSPHRHPRRC